jgi:hypothetical protein
MSYVAGMVLTDPHVFERMFGYRGRVASTVGLAWFQPSHGQEIYLVIDHGRVVGCPPFAEKWALNRTGREILAEQKRRNATVTFVPLSAPPSLFNAHDVHTTSIRRWRWTGPPHEGGHLTFGSIEDGSGWFVHDTSGYSWRFALADEAWNECRRRMADDPRWVRVPTAVGLHGEAAQEDPPLPDELEAHLRKQGQVDAAQ